MTSALTAGTGTLVPVTTMGYDTLTGLPTTTSNGTKTQTVAYDDFGQPVSYTDGDGAKTITARDGQDRPTAVSWTKTDGVSTLGSVSYAYLAPASGDHRGQVASVTDSVLGAVVGSYDVAGALSSQTLASGLTQSFTTDPVGDTTSTSWADGAGIVFLSDSQVSDIHGRWRVESLAGVDPGWNARTYGYDGAGRLTTVAEARTVGGCLTRSYGLDVNSNRTSAVTYPSDAAGGCTTTSTPTATTTVNVDDADRMLPTGTATGTVYDPWGRITTLPAALTSTPTAGVAGVTYANDLVRSLSQGGATRTWALDPANRLATMTSTGLGATALTNHYGDPGSDSPTWTVDTAADATVSTRRYVGGLAGFLAEVTTTAAGVSTSTVELTGLHGDVLRTSAPAATGSPDGLGNDTDEYGIVHDSTGAITTGPRYNWLGGKQRATDTGTTGLTLMGVRLYTPTTGRFLSGDPIYGGNANTYGYPADPVNQSDETGAMVASIEHGAGCDAACGRLITFALHQVAVWVNGHQRAVHRIGPLPEWVHAVLGVVLGIVAAAVVFAVCPECIILIGIAGAAGRYIGTTRSKDWNAGGLAFECAAGASAAG